MRHEWRSTSGEMVGTEIEKEIDQRLLTLMGCFWRLTKQIMFVALKLITHINSSMVIQNIMTFSQLFVIYHAPHFKTNDGYLSDALCAANSNFPEEFNYRHLLIYMFDPFIVFPM